jgi:hypothetical protein
MQRIPENPLPGADFASTDFPQPSGMNTLAACEKKAPAQNAASSNVG